MGLETTPFRLIRNLGLAVIATSRTIGIAKPMLDFNATRDIVPNDASTGVIPYPEPNHLCAARGAGAKRFVSQEHIQQSVRTRLDWANHIHTSNQWTTLCWNRLQILCQD
jgi:hypothetical protein